MIWLGQADATVREAATLIEQGRLDAAEAAIALLPPDSRRDVALLGGLLAFARGELARALALTGKAVQLDIEHAESLTSLARVQLALGQPDFALVPAQRAVRLAPGLAEAQAVLAATCAALEQLPGALDSVRRAAAAAALAQGLSAPSPGFRDSAAELAAAAARAAEKRAPAGD